MSGVNSHEPRATEFLQELLEQFDLPKFLEALPVGEFENLLSSLDERITERDADAERAQTAAKQLRSEKATIEQALAARKQLLEARERERNQTSVVEPLPSRIMSPKRKRAAVLRVFEENPGEAQSPASIRRHLARAGLIDPDHEKGTPVRIILAQMREAGVLVRVGPGEYRLKTRDEQVALAGANQARE
jgi:multidrug efflux pump subunit AcrA (membrane-fusion protein)